MLLALRQRRRPHERRAAVQVPGLQDGGGRAAETGRPRRERREPRGKAEQGDHTPNHTPVKAYSSVEESS